MLLRRSMAGLADIGAFSAFLFSFPAHQRVLFEREWGVATMSILLLLAGVISSFQSAFGPQQVFYRASGYTVERNGPQQCSMRQPASPGTEVHLSYHSGHGNISVSYYRPGFRPIGGSSIVFDFGDGETRQPVRSLYLAAGPENVSTFLTIDRATLDLWGRSRSVTLRFNDAARTPVETLRLNGSGAAVRNLIACAQGEAPTSAPSAD
jgi:hypothetical protein